MFNVLTHFENSSSYISVLKMSRVPKLSDNSKNNNSSYYLKKAKQLCVENEYTQAYEYFVNYFESLNDPLESTHAVQTVFTTLVCKIGTVLEETDNIEELLKCYLQALNLFPNNYVILNNLGAYMFKTGEIDIAKRYLERAVRNNANYLPAEKNLMHLKWHQLPRWHFKMLNDKRRNIAYNEAISLAILEGYKNIVDVGSGCGFLSLVASRNPDAKVNAIEENATLAKMGRDILEANKASNVNLFNCYSTDITEPLDKCNLIITEIFDVALFGERALESICHALTVLRTEDNFKIIPCGAKVFCAGINSEDLARKHYFLNLKSLKILNLDKLCIQHRDSEPYDAEFLSEKEFMFKTESQQIFDINFNDINQIYSILNNINEEKLLDLKCNAGVIHAITVWFDLYLTERIVITTNPTNKDSVDCWEQAIFYLDHPITADEGDIITVKVTLSDCKLNVSVVGYEKHHECFKVSREIITFLNDEELVNTFIRVTHKLTNAKLNVVDFNVFPLVGFLLAKNNCTVYHVTKSDVDRFFFNQILTLNNIPSDNFVFLNEDVPLEMDIQNQQNLFFFDVINTDGSLENSFFKKKSEIISSIHVPKVIKVHVQLIYSSYIINCNKIDDSNVMGFKIAKYMNEYSGYEHPNLDNFSYQKYSDSVSFILNENGEKSSTVTVTESGMVNCLYCWYEIQFYQDIVFSTLKSSHFKKTCFFIQDPKCVTINELVTIKMHTDGSYIKFSLE